MAAVLVLVMLPVVASIGLFLGVVGTERSLAAASAGVAFVSLAVGVLFSSLRFVLKAERDVVNTPQPPRR